MCWHDRTNYQRGADLERKAASTLLHDYGALLVVRAAGSHGKADLVALFEPDVISWHADADVAAPHVWLVQVKKDARLPAEEREALLQIAAETATVPVLAYAVRGQGVRFAVVIEEGGCMPLAIPTIKED